jgi:hypothetical protein
MVLPEGILIFQFTDMEIICDRIRERRINCAR